MAEGYASDIDGDDTVMDSPHVTVSIDLSTLPPQQALAIAHEDIDQFEPYNIGSLMQGEDVTDAMSDAQFHLPLGHALSALDELDVIDLPEQPPEQGAEQMEGDEDVDVTEVPE
jgi:hypothetical protein